MSWKKIGKLIGSHAPMLGSLVGGKGGEMVGSIIASTLGVDNTPEAIEAAIASDPNAALKLRELELQDGQRIRQMAMDVTRIELADKQDARKRHAHNPMPMLICIALTVMVALAGYLLFTIDIPADNEEIAYLLFGTLLAKWSDSIAYWVGTTRSSAEKTRMQA